MYCESNLSDTTVYAPGQTGSGKTHTMRAIMRSAARDIFQHIRTTRDREFLLRLSAIEIYNEMVKDLLKDGDAQLKVMDDPEKGNVVEDLSDAGVDSAEELERILRVVEKHRHVRNTSWLYGACNHAAWHNGIYIACWIRRVVSPLAFSGHFMPCSYSNRSPHNLHTKQTD